MAINPETLRAVFGIDDPTVATRLLSQLVSVIQPDPRKLIDAALIDQVLALIEMTATMLVGAQHAALDSLRRASHPPARCGWSATESDGVTAYAVSGSR